MTPRSAAEPGTAAGRALTTWSESDADLLDKYGFRTVRDAILAIEAEAARREAALREALRDLEGREPQSEWDGWRNYSELKRDLRNLLHDNAGATAAVPLDVERLRAASQAHRSSESKAWAAKGEYHVTHMCGDGDCWDKIAAEYARLASADEEGT